MNDKQSISINQIFQAIRNLDSQEDYKNISYNLTANNTLAPDAWWVFIPYGQWSNNLIPPNPSPFEKAILQAIPSGSRNHCFIDIIDIWRSDSAFFDDQSASGPTIIEALADFINSLPSDVTPIIRYLVGASPYTSPQQDTFISDMYNRRLFTNEKAMLYCGNFDPNFPVPGSSRFGTSSNPDSMVTSIWQWLEEEIEKLWAWLKAEVKKFSSELYEAIKKIESEIIGWIKRYIHIMTPLSWQHAKIFAVNGRTLVTGGANYWQPYATGNQLLFDMSMSITGDAAIDAHLFANYFWQYLAFIPPWDESSWCQANLLTNPLSGFADARAPLYTDTPTNTGNISALSVGKNGNWPFINLGYPAQIFDGMRDFIVNIVAAIVDSHLNQNGAWIAGVASLLSDDNTAFRSILSDAGINPAAWASRYARNYAVSQAEQSVRVSQQTLVDPYAELYSAEYARLVADINSYLQTSWDGAIWPYDLLMALGSALSNMSNSTAPNVTGVEIVTSTPTSNIGGYQDSTPSSVFRQKLTEIMEGMLTLGYINPTGYIPDIISKYLVLKRIDNTPPDSNPTHASHSKLVLVDNSVCYIGSDNAYPAYCEEFGIWIDDQASVESFITDYWDGLWNFAQPSTYMTKAGIKRTPRTVYHGDMHISEDTINRY